MSTQKQVWEQKKSLLKFPVPRVKKIIQENQEIGKINNVVPHLTTKSLELFLSDILEQTVNFCKQTNQNKITPQFLKSVVLKSKYDFIKDAVEYLPDIQDNNCKNKQKVGRKKSDIINKVEDKSKKIKKNHKKNIIEYDNSESEKGEQSS